MQFITCTAAYNRISTRELADRLAVRLSSADSSMTLIAVVTLFSTNETKYLEKIKHYVCIIIC